MRIYVDGELVTSLASHLEQQGFPALQVCDGVLDVLFPGSQAIFAAAVELDLWQARLERQSVKISFVDDGAGRRPGSRHAFFVEHELEAVGQHG